jgi:bacterioferritin
MNLIPLLNEDLALEYAAAIQYFQHASTIHGLYTTYASTIREHAEDELSHAKLLSDHIQFLGGVPVANVGPMYTASDSDSMLRQDLAGERTAISRYRERISQARGQSDFGTEAVLLGILKDEEEHANDLQTILQD